VSRAGAKIAKAELFDRVPPPHVGGYGSRHRRSRSRRGGTGNVSVRLHGKGNVGAKPKAEVVADILLAVKERKA
jgi:hypothetical protein